MSDVSSYEDKCNKIVSFVRSDGSEFDLTPELVGKGVVFLDCVDMSIYSRQPYFDPECIILNSDNGPNTLLTALSLSRVVSIRVSPLSGRGKLFKVYVTGDSEMDLVESALRSLMFWGSDKTPLDSLLPNGFEKSYITARVILPVEVSHNTSYADKSSTNEWLMRKGWPYKA